jgi:SAM-dependent methyltransferase
MSDVPPEADTYDPALYDLFHPHDREESDVAFYRDLARERGGPVLELGAGTGRTLLPVARAGVEIHGLDTSARMLAALRERLEGEVEEVRARVTIAEGDMREFSLDRRFAVVQIPFRGFLHNRTRAEQLRCLRACLDHLEPGGVLAFSVFHPSIEIMGANAGAFSGVWRWRGERATPDGGRVALSECTIYDTPNQLLSARLRYEKYDPQGRLEFAHMHGLELAYLYPGDLRGLLAEAGFGDVEIEGGFDGAPFTDDRQELIVRAVAP